MEKPNYDKLLEDAVKKTRANRVGETVWVVMNEQHKLLPEQKEILDAKFGDSWKFLLSPKNGWSIEEMDAEMAKMKLDQPVVFVSPIGYMILELGTQQGARTDGYAHLKHIFLFHNSKREKKELPNGRVISVTAKTGWQLV